jgi:hypothetical protein
VVCRLIADCHPPIRGIRGAIVRHWLQRSGAILAAEEGQCSPYRTTSSAAQQPAHPQQQPTDPHEGCKIVRAGSGLAVVEKYVEEHRYTLVLQAQEVGLFAQRYRVDQPRTHTEGQGNSGGGLHHKEAQVDSGRWEGGSWPAAMPPSPLWRDRRCEATILPKSLLLCFGDHKFELALDLHDTMRLLVLAFIVGCVFAQREPFVSFWIHTILNLNA